MVVCVRGGSGIDGGATSTSFGFSMIANKWRSGSVRMSKEISEGGGDEEEDDEEDEDEEGVEEERREVS